jgi:hypothetical protein
VPTVNRLPRRPMLLLAHAGHVLMSAPLFLAPVLLLGGALAISTRRERRRNQD